MSAHWTFANKANNMVQDIVAESKFLIQDIGIKFREDSGVRGTQILNSMSKKNGRKIISKCPSKRSTIGGIRFQLWFIGLRKIKSPSFMWRIERKPQLQDCSADCLKIELSKFCKNFVNNSSLTWGLENKLGQSWAKLSRSAQLKLVNWKLLFWRGN